MYAVGGYGSASEHTVKLFSKVLHEHGNYAPKGWREITEKEFSQSLFFTYTPVAIEYRQLTCDYDGNKLNEKYMLAVKMFMMHDGTGVAISADYWEGKLRFFAFGCQHEYREYGREYATEHKLPYEGGRCMHNYHCKKCSDVMIHDSSD
jgi:hypothetical protein